MVAGESMNPLKTFSIRLYALYPTKIELPCKFKPNPRSNLSLANVRSALMLTKIS